MPVWFKVVYLCGENLIFHQSQIRSRPNLMKEMYAQWRKDLIEAEKLKPDEKINNVELSTRWQKLQVEKIKSGSFRGRSFSKEMSMKSKP